MTESFLKVPQYAQGGGQRTGVIFEMSMGILQKKEFAIVSHVRAKTA
jgi:hypothetical protein